MTSRSCVSCGRQLPRRAGFCPTCGEATPTEIGGATTTIRQSVFTGTTAVDYRPRLRAVLADRYQVEHEVGRGGTAIVYRAIDRKHGRAVALKVLATELGSSLGPKRFLREIDLAARLQHPHILPLYDSGDADGLLYYVMPFVEGESLRDRLRREQQLSVADAVDIAREVALTLQFAHAQGVVHRDIKPENILLPDGRAVVADFGIATALSVAGGDRLTESGIAIGTPAYMSPEQATGARRIDGRSDVYSLGCVLYEMLVGEPPFTGPSSQSILARHLQEPPRSLRVVRPSVPPEVERIVGKALAKAPVDRYSSARAFAEALAAPTAGAAAGTTEAAGPRPRSSRFVKAAIAAFVVLAGVASLPLLLRGPPMDRTLHAVLPFHHRDGAAPTLLNGDQCELLLHETLSRWEDVKLVDPLRANDVRVQRATAPLTLSAALDVARHLGAGLLLWGEVWERQDTVFVRSVLYDVAARGRMLRQHTVRLAGPLPDLGARFAELARELIRDPSAGTGSADAALGTSSLAAWRAYEAGRGALKSWDLAAAREAFDRAVTLDPRYGHAHLWLAQVAMWRGEPPGEWSGSAALAASAPEQLSSRDDRVAHALLALSEGRFPDACARYRELLAEDSLDFTAWHGLGECHALDSIVAPDTASPSGWRFRGSYHTAVEAFRRAVEIIPSFNFAFGDIVFPALARRLHTEHTRLRLGYAVDRDTLRFAAFPGLEADTLTYWPYPLADLAAGLPHTMPPTKHLAVRRNQGVLRQVAQTWARAFPDSAAAHEAVARALEIAGEVTGPSGSRSALASVRRARALSRSGPAQLRLAIAEMRLLLKAERFDSAVRVGDSLLRNERPLDPMAAGWLGEVAGLLGRPHLSAELLARTAPEVLAPTFRGEMVSAPRPLTEVAMRLLAYAAVGTPADSVRALSHRTDSLVDLWVEPDRRPMVRDAFLERPHVLAYDVVGLGVAHRRAGGYLLVMQAALAAGDTAHVRRRFAELQSARAGTRPGDVALPGTYQEAWLLLSLGDTAAATALLDRSLNALPTLGIALLGSFTPQSLPHPQAPALPRAMALRAELAARAGDARSARRWARPVVALWSHADPEFQPILARMQLLAGSAPDR